MRRGARAGLLGLAVLLLVACNGVVLTDGQEGRVELAQEVVELTVGRDSATAMLDQLLSESDPPVEQRMEAVLREELDGGIEQLQSQLATVYAREFTADELRAIRDFYKTPAGIALRQRQTALAPETSRISAEWMGQVLERARLRYAREAEGYAP